MPVENQASQLDYRKHTCELHLLNEWANHSPSAQIFTNQNTVLTAVEANQKPGHYNHLVGVDFSTEQKESPGRESEGIIQQHPKLSRKSKDCQCVNSR